MIRLVNASAYARRRFVLQAGHDAGCWILAVLVATLLRYEFDVARVSNVRVLEAGLVAATLQVFIAPLFGLYIHRYRYGSMAEVMVTALAVVPVVTLLALTNRFVLGRLIPVSASLSAGVIALLFMCVGRCSWRMWFDRLLRPDPSGADRVIVFGAGEGGFQVIRAMLGQRAGKFVPVAMLDDNRDVANLRIRGISVMGTRSDLARIAARLDVQTLVIAVPSASAELLRELSALADEAGLKTLVVPRVTDLFGTPIGVSDLRPLTEADLLGRREIRTDVDSIAGYLTGKRVLVTGAGGSIGSELCRQLHRLAPASLVMLDRDESALHAVQLSIEGRALLEDQGLVVACIRDSERLREVFNRHRPEVIFHAAALKHLPLLEMHPDEGWKTNVLGTENLLRMSLEFGIERFVNISTDKAADPSSVLGQTKRLAEQLTAQAAEESGRPYLSVRFGNVLGSRGSVLPVFRAQVEAGGPVTVTHPDVTRFFMTIPESCELVIQAGALGSGGEVMVLDMGEPVRISDLARRLIAESGKKIELVYTGLRPGEKLQEALFGVDEFPQASSHPMISVVAVPPVRLPASESTGQHLIDLRDDVRRLAGESA